jgi:MoaA/NifB/PqqE/SkfB family radical SAM enzyme
MDYPKPWSVQIELTEGCNRRCTFCGIHSLYREKGDVHYKHMSVEKAKMIAKDLNQWLGKCRIEFAMQGEPLLNPHVYKIIKAFRDYFPKAQLMITTNCDPISTKDGFDQEKVKKIFQCGLNMFVADYYQPNRYSYEEFFSKWNETKLGIPCFDYFKDKPTVWGYESPSMQKIVVINNTETRDFNREMNNQAGNLDPQFVDVKGYHVGDLPVKKRCHLPFREMAIKHDGALALCCMDWQRESIIGKFPELSYKEIWESDPMNKARGLLWSKERGMLSPCNRCNYHPNKVGLITNPYDEEDMPDMKELARGFRQHQNKMKEEENKYARKPFVYKK